MCSRWTWIAAGLALWGVAASAGPQSWVTLARGLRRGDAFEATRTYTVQMDGTSTTDTGDCHTYTGSIAIRDQYSQYVASPRAGGQPREVRRTYLSSTICRTLDGGRSTTTPRSIQGKTITLMDSPAATRVCPCKGLSDFDQSELKDATIDEFADLLPNRTCVPGDRWPLPQRFFRQFDIEGPASGMCTCDGLVPKKGEAYFRVRFVGRQEGIDSRGCRYDLALDGYMLWSFALARPVYLEYRAPATISYSTQRGATVLRYTGHSVCALTLDLKWTKPKPKQ